MRASSFVRFFGLVLGVVVGVGPACNLFNDLGNAWVNAETSSSGGGDMCAGFGGDGGEGGAGGDDDGAGGDGAGGSFGDAVGAGGSSSFGDAVGAGGSGSFGDAVGASVGAGAGDVRPNGGVGHAARTPRHHRGRRGGIGKAQQAGCTPQIEPPSPCVQLCESDYDDAALVCGKIEAGVENQVCDDGAYAAYKSCGQDCGQGSSWRKGCEDSAEACEAQCRKIPSKDKEARRKCWVACSEAEARCKSKCKD